jgi:hypothetical protein
VVQFGEAITLVPEVRLPSISAVKDRAPRGSNSEGSVTYLVGWQSTSTQGPPARS